MANKVLTLVGVALLSVALWACSTSPLGRRQLHLFPSGLVSDLGENAFAEIKRTTPHNQQPDIVTYVACVAEAITGALGAPDAWEVVVFDDDSVNAFALPGRKIGIYRGLLNVATSADQLGAVIGHEIAHVLAEHSNERLSNEYLVSAALNVIRGRISPSPEAYAALGLGAQVGILLPYSRKQEEEADLVGLDLMARAGFSPDAAVTLWQSMAQQDSPAVPELLSTHPADESRIRAIETRLPDARQRYAEQVKAAGRPQCKVPAGVN